MCAFVQPQTAAGSGDVTGPGSSTDNAVARFDSTSGKILQNSSFIVSDGGAVTTGTWASTDIPLSAGGTGASLADPGADRIFFWDDGETSSAFLAVGDSIAITTTTIDTIQDIRTSASPSFTGLTVSAGISTHSGLIQRLYSAALADDAEIAIATGVAGWGTAMIGDNQESAEFVFTAAGAVTLTRWSSSNVVNTDTDAKFCIYDAGSGIAIKNRLGSELNVKLAVYYA